MNATAPVTAADLVTAVALAADTLTGAVDRDWHVPAGTIAWDCWETVEHIADDLFAYAAQLGPRKPPQDRYLPIAAECRYEGAPYVSTFADPAGGNVGLIQMLEAFGAFLAAMVERCPPGVRAWHPFGLADAEGWAAMGIVEVLVHMQDVAAGLGLGWAPPEDVCDRVLRRLFPDAPTGTGRWPTLLWATGRGEIEGRDRVVGEWRWFAAPPETRI